MKVDKKNEKDVRPPYCSFHIVGVTSQPYILANWMSLCHHISAAEMYDTISVTQQCMGLNVYWWIYIYMGARWRSG